MGGDLVALFLLGEFLKEFVIIWEVIKVEVFLKHVDKLITAGVT